MTTFRIVQPHGHPTVAWILRETGPRVDSWKRNKRRKYLLWRFLIVLLGIIILVRP